MGERGEKDREREGGERERVTWCFTPINQYSYIRARER